MKLFKVALPIFLAVSVAGCATILNGTSQKVMVTSNPTGAVVEVDGKYSRETPVKLRLERKRDHVLVITKEGYEKQAVNLTHVLSASVCGNILLGGVLGWVFDIFAGTQYKLIPNKVHVEMKGS